MFLLAMSSVSRGQAVPAGGGSTQSLSPTTSGFNLSPIDGTIHYALTASEVIQYGYYSAGEVTHSTVLSGDVAYAGTSTVRPFSLLMSGGVVIGNQGGQGTTTFWNVGVSQGYSTRKWIFNISDYFNFLPQSPTTGITGISGVGDLGAVPIQGPSEGPAGGIFTNAGNRIGNTVNGTVERQLDHATSISGIGSYFILHFLNSSDGLDSSGVTGSIALNRRLDARSSVSVDAVYSTYSYSGNQSGSNTPDIETKGINVSYQRLLSRSFNASVSAGPQWVSSSNSTLVPSALNVAASARLAYTRGNTGASVNYSRGVDAGSGVLPGGLSDNVSASLGHTYGRNWVASISAAYTHTTGLTQIATGVPGTSTNQVYDTVYGGIQVTRRISTRFSGYLSYGAQNQSSNYLLGSQNALNGTSQTFGIGITFTPRSTRLGQF